MVGVVGLVHEVGDGQLQLINEQPAGLARWRQVVPGPQIEEDAGGLGISISPWRREGRLEEVRVTKGTSSTP